MGLFDLFLRTAETLLPTALDLLDGSRESSEPIDSTNVDEMIAECEEFISVVIKLSPDDEEDIINTLTAFDRRYLKLDRIDAKTDNFALSKKLNELEGKREKAIDTINDMYYSLLKEINEKSEQEHDRESWLALNDEWNKYNNKLSKITNYQFKYLERFSRQASSLIGD